MRTLPHYLYTPDKAETANNIALYEEQVHKDSDGNNMCNFQTQKSN